MGGHCQIVQGKSRSVRIASSPCRHLAILTLCERMSIEVRQQNIMVTDCGSRDNMADYIWLALSSAFRIWR